MGIAAPIRQRDQALGGCAPVAAHKPLDDGGEKNSPMVIETRSGDFAVDCALSRCSVSGAARFKWLGWTCAGL
jgi:hypothetical protein